MKIPLKRVGWNTHIGGFVAAAVPAAAEGASAVAAGASAGTTALTVATIASAVIAAGATAYGAQAQASAQKKSAQFNAKIASNNAGASYQQSRYDQMLIDQRNRERVGKLRSAAASSGLDANSGSFTDVQQSVEVQGELDRLSRVYEGRLGINRSRSEADLYGMQASQSGDIAVAGGLSSAATLIGGATQAGMIYENPQFR